MNNLHLFNPPPSTPAHVPVSPHEHDDVDVETADDVSLQQRVHDLEQESIQNHLIIGNLEHDLEVKTVRIAALQTSLSNVTSIVLDLQKQLSEKFPGEFQVNESAAAPSSSAPTKRKRKSSSRRPPANDSAPPFQNADQLLDEYLNSGPKTVIEKRKLQERGKIQKLKHKEMLIFKNSDPRNEDGNRAEMLVAVGDPFTDIHGDRTGVARWGYDGDKRLYYVTRNSGREEHFKYRSQFHSFTALGIQEMLRAPFFNDSENNQAYSFRRHLINQARRGFPNFEVAQPRVTVVRDLYDENDRPFKQVMWPPTDKEKAIPMAKPLPDGSLRTIKLWVFDHNSLSAVIRL